MATVRARLDAGGAAAALELLGRVVLRELEPGERESVEALRADAKASLETREMEASFERLLQAGDPLAAREVVERLLSRASEGERTTRQGQVAAAREAARRAFGVWAFPVDDNTAERDEAPDTIELCAPLTISASGREPVPWLDAAARSLVLLESCDHWIFVQLVDLAVGRVRACVVIRTPEPLNSPTTAVSPANTLTIAADNGVLELSLENWDPVSSSGRSSTRPRPPSWRPSLQPAQVQEAPARP